MTEAEWLATDDPRAMLAYLGGRATDRKLRLFAAACARLVWDALPDDRYRGVVAGVEAHADARTNGERRRIRGVRAAAGGLAWEVGVYRAGWLLSDPTGLASALHALTRRNHAEAASSTAHAVAVAARRRGDGHAGSAIAARLRDVVGDPFRPPRLRPRWLTPTARDLASVIYHERAYDRLPVLADALEEAGCDDPGVLAHCRDAGPHVRGCWAVDLVLGRK